MGFNRLTEESDWLGALQGPADPQVSPYSAMGALTRHPRGILQTEQEDMGRPFKGLFGAVCQGSRPEATGAFQWTCSLA